MTSLFTACSDKSNNSKQVDNDKPDVELFAGVGVVTGVGEFGELSPTQSKTLTFKITNTGDAALMGPPSIDQAGFDIIYQSGCAEIAPKKVCNLKVNFNAKGKLVQEYNANLNLDSAFVALHASIVDPNATATASASFSAGTALDFGTITDKQSLVKNITITNSGTVTINEPVTLGTSFSLSFDTCSNKAILPGKTCSLKVSLVGSGKSGALNETLTYANSVLNLTAQVNSSQGTSSSGSPVITFLNGTTDAGGLVDFATLTGNQSKQIILNIKNTGNANTVSSTATLDNSNFSIAYNQCVNKILAPNAACQVRLVFSSSGKATNTYTSVLSFAGSSVNISGQVQVITTYEAVYSAYGTCSANLACMGSGVKTRTISTCKQLDNGVAVGNVDVSNCASFAVAANLEQSCPSPSGQKTEIIEGGSKIISCSTGQTTGNTVSVTCSQAGYSKSADGLSCVGVVVTYNPAFSDYQSCSVTEACQGEGQETRTVQMCERVENGIPTGILESSSLCSNDVSSVDLTRSCLSPAGEITVSVTGGSEIRSCEIGQEVANSSLVSLTCDPGFNDSNGQCIPDGPITLKSIVVTKNSTTGGLTLSPPATNVVTLDATSTKYEYPENTTVTISAPSNGTTVIDYFSGACSGTSCSLSLTENKAVLVAYKDSASRFKSIEINTNPIPTCILPDGQDIVGNNYDVYSQQVNCESQKNVQWNEFDCGSYTDEFSCQDGTNYRCFWDNMGGPGGGYDPCRDQFGSDEFMCNDYGWQYGCYFDYNMWSCTNGSGGGGSCQGGYQAFCMDNDSGTELYQISSAESCTPENSVGTFAYSTKTFGALETSSISDPIILNGVAYVVGYPNLSYNSGNLVQYLIGIDGSNNISVKTNTTNFSRNLIRHPILFNNQIYYYDYNLIDGANSKLRRFDGTNTFDVATMSSSTDYVMRTQILNGTLMLFTNKNIYTLNTSNVLTSIFSNSSINYANLGSTMITTKDFVFSCMSVSGSNVGTEMYKISTSGVTLIADLVPGTANGCDSGGISGDVVDFNQNIITYTAAITSDSYNVRLVKTDGTSIVDMTSTTNSPNATRVLGSYILPFASSMLNKIFYTGYVSNFDWEPFVINSPYSANSSVLLQDLNTATKMSQPQWIGEVNSKVLFVGYSSTNYQNISIYATNGNVGQVENLITLPNPSTDFLQNPYYQKYFQENAGMVIGTKMYFLIGYRYLYESDGTAAGTQLIKDFNAEGKRAVIGFKRNNKIYIYTYIQNSINSNYEIELFDPSL